MILKEIRRHYEEVSRQTDEGKLLDALENLRILVKESPRSDFESEWERISTTYLNLLKYAFEGYHDPKQQTILDSLSASILTLADQIWNVLSLRYLPFRRNEHARLAAVFGNDPLMVSGRVEEFLLDREVGQIIQESSMTAGEDAPAERMENIFGLIWLTENIMDYHIDLTRKVNESKTVNWPEKCQIVSALTLSILHFFDIRKLLLLTEFIERREPQVYQRALAGLIITLIRYDRRAASYPELSAKLRELTQDENLVAEAEVVFLQLLSARETEKITREFQEEVLPDMKKMMPKIEDKLQLGEITDDPEMDDKNPEWKEMMEEVPGLFEKLERFSKMQMEGSDVFMGTFSLLKRFDFFIPMSNWFLPFYKENPLLASSFPPDDPYHERLFEGLENAFYICNSDKYSFALNVAVIPAQQRSMIVSYFEAELSQMKDLATEEQMLDQSISSNSIIIQYIQDLYRFFKLFPARVEFADIFQGQIRFRDLAFFKGFFERKAFTERIAAWHFDKEHWDEAIPMFDYLVETAEPRADLYQKAGYAAQMLGQYAEAISYYRKAELFDTDQLWILNKLGWCHMKTGAFEEAIRYFRQALQLNPDDPKLLGQIARCHIQRQEFGEALKIYTGLRFFMPDNLKVLRPIAFCLFVLGRLSEAEESYDEVLGGTGKKTMYDYLNAGHVKLCLGKRNEAAELYRLAVSGTEPPWTAFFQAMEEDAPWLMKNGITEKEITLIRDFLKYSFK